MTKLMYRMDEYLSSSDLLPPEERRWVIGVVYVTVFGRYFLGLPKPIDFKHYPMPAFFGTAICRAATLRF